MKKIIIVLLIIGVGGFLFYDFSKKPDLVYGTEAGDFGFLTVNSDIENSTIWIKMQSFEGKLKFSDGPFKVNGDFGGSEWMKIGMAPISKYKLPTSNVITVKYVYGLLKGEKEKSASVDCIYDLKVEAKGKEPKIIKDIVLTTNNTASFNVSLQHTTSHLW